MQTSKYQPYLTQPPQLSAEETNICATTNFILQLYRLLQSAENKDLNKRAIHWNGNGDALVISNASKFTEQLSLYFKARKLKSFVRQLNMYSFSKVKRSGGALVFRHPFFKRDRAFDLRYVTRKNTKKNIVNKKITKANSKLGIKGGIIKSKLKTIEKRLDNLLYHNRKLKAMNRQLTEEYREASVSYENLQSQLLNLFITLIFIPETSLTPKIKLLIKGLKSDPSDQHLSPIELLFNSSKVHQTNNTIDMSKLLSSLKDILGLLNNSKDNRKVSSESQSTIIANTNNGTIDCNLSVLGINDNEPSIDESENNNNVDDLGMGGNSINELGIHLAGNFGIDESSDTETTECIKKYSEFASGETFESNDAILE